MNKPPSSIFAALRRARAPILWIGATYLAGALLGAILVHAHNPFSLHMRDSLVRHAQQSDPAAKAFSHHAPWRAALLDFFANLLLGAIPTTLLGLAIVLPFPMAAFRGWVGGIVSVGAHGTSRLANPQEAAYYLAVLLLQIIPYAMTGGAGVRLGLGFLLPRSRWSYESQQRWLGIPAEGVRDVLRVYAIAAPLFLIASLVEFLAR